MCNAVYAAAVLAALVAGLTYLRIKDAKSPNAELLADLLNDQPGRTGLPARPEHSGHRKGAPCPPAADSPC